MRAPRTSLTGGLVYGIASSSTGTRCKGGNSPAMAAAEMTDNATTAIKVCFIDLPPVSSIFSECCSATFIARGLRRVKRVILQPLLEQNRRSHADARPDYYAYPARG